VRSFRIVLSSLCTLVVLISLSPGAALAGPARSTQKHVYSGPGFNMPLAMVSCSGQDVAVASGGGTGFDNPEVRFHTRIAWHDVSFRIADQSATKVWAVAWQGRRVIGTFCGSTKKPFAIRGTEPVTVALYDAITNSGVSIVTSGTVTAAFST
jgi:hypothetical protein